MGRGMSSDSSMDDCNLFKKLGAPKDTGVQIPLWTIVTLYFPVTFSKFEPRSDSSMDDCNGTQRLSLKGGDRGSDSSMDDCNAWASVTS